MKTIGISFDLWKRLTIKKAELNLASLEDTIEHLIKENKNISLDTMANKFIE
jgi:predicted CopG family antitoxin